MTFDDPAPFLIEYEGQLTEDDLQAVAKTQRGAISLEAGMWLATLVLATCLAFRPGPPVYLHFVLITVALFQIYRWARAARKPSPRYAPRSVFAKQPFQGRLDQVGLSYANTICHVRYAWGAFDRYFESETCFEFDIGGTRAFFVYKRFLSAAQQVELRGFLARRWPSHSSASRGFEVVGPHNAR